MAFCQDIMGMAIIGAEKTAPLVLLVDQWQESEQIFGP
jgi:hypothetical protein